MSGAPDGGIDTDFGFTPIQGGVGPQTGGTRSTPWGRFSERGGLGGANAAIVNEPQTAGDGPPPPGDGGNGGTSPRGNLRGCSSPDSIKTTGSRYLEQNEFSERLTRRSTLVSFLAYDD